MKSMAYEEIERNAALQTTGELVDALRQQVGDDAADALAQLLERATPGEASEDPAPAIDLATVEPANDQAS